MSPTESCSCCGRRAAGAALFALHKTGQVRHPGATTSATVGFHTGPTLRLPLCRRCVVLYRHNGPLRAAAGLALLGSAAAAATGPASLTLLPAGAALLLGLATGRGWRWLLGRGAMRARHPRYTAWVTDGYREVRDAGLTRRQGRRGPRRVERRWLLYGPVALMLALALLLGRGEQRCYPRASILAAIRAVESGGREHPPDGDDGAAIGPYQIHRGYWADAVAFDPELGGSYQDCRQRDYAERVVATYMERWVPAAWREGDAEVIARTHNGGPGGATKQATLRYWDRVRAALLASPDAGGGVAGSSAR